MPFEGRAVAQQAQKRSNAGPSPKAPAAERGHSAGTNIRVLPFSTGAHPAMSGPFVLPQLIGGDDNVVFLEGANGDTISHDDQATCRHYDEGSSASKPSRSRSTQAIS